MSDDSQLHAVNHSHSKRVGSSERQFSAHVELKHDKQYTLSQTTQMKSHQIVAE